jgi:hypothetical protein
MAGQPGALAAVASDSTEWQQQQQQVRTYISLQETNKKQLISYTMHSDACSNQRKRRLSARAVLVTAMQRHLCLPAVIKQCLLLFAHCRLSEVLQQQGVKPSVLTADTPLTPILAIGSNAGMKQAASLCCCSHCISHIAFAAFCCLERGCCLAANAVSALCASQHAAEPN